MADLLINTLDNPGEFDALTSLRPDEPYFILLARDRLAPPLVRQWAEANRERALVERENMTPEAYDRELRKSTDAEAVSWAMDAYKAGQNVKAAQERQVQTYSGHELPEATKLRDQIQSARNRARSAINNAVAEATALVELLRLGDETERCQADLYGYTIIEMDALSDALAPRRIVHPAPLLDDSHG